MLKKLQIEVAFNNQDSQTVTAIRTIGYDDRSISDQLELLGMLENIKHQIQERITKISSQKFTIDQNGNRK